MLDRERAESSEIHTSAPQHFTLDNGDEAIHDGFRFQFSQAGSG